MRRYCERNSSSGMKRFDLDEYTFGDDMGMQRNLTAFLTWKARFYRTQKVKLTTSDLNCVSLFYENLPFYFDAKNDTEQLKLIEEYLESEKHIDLNELVNITSRITSILNLYEICHGDDCDMALEFINYFHE